jgi:two-component system invasion response regulator UvrY
MIRILIADDHPVVRAGLKQILAEASDIKITGEAADGHEVLARVREGDFDVVLLDLTIPGITGIDVLKQVKTEKPALPVLILSVHPEDHYAVRVLRAGAAGYLTKASVPEQLVQAVRKVYQGGKYVSAALAEKLAEELEAGWAHLPHESLSDREYQVLCMIASGKTMTEIAEALALSVKTVSTYRARILEKMRMQTNAELTSYAVKNNLVD